MPYETNEAAKFSEQSKESERRRISLARRSPAG